MPPVDGGDMADLAKARLRARELDKAARKRGDLLADASVAAPKAFRCVVLGDAEVGKSSFGRSLVGEPFKEGYEPTMDESGPTEWACTVHTSVGPVLLTVVDWAWDQMYQVKQVPLEPHLASGADGAIYMFSYASPDTFKNLTFRFVEYDRASGGKKPSLFVGNKTDTPKLRVKETDVWDAARKRGDKSDFVSCCAASGEGVADAALALVKLLLDDESVTLTPAKVEGGRGDAYLTQLGRSDAFAKLSAWDEARLSEAVCAHLGFRRGQSGVTSLQLGGGRGIMRVGSTQSPDEPSKRDEHRGPGEEFAVGPPRSRDSGSSGE